MVCTNHIQFVVRYVFANVLNINKFLFFLHSRVLELKKLLANENNEIGIDFCKIGDSEHLIHRKHNPDDQLMAFSDQHNLEHTEL